MIVAHLPAGYVLYRAVGSGGQRALAAFLAGSVAPDLDMFWFAFVDSSVHHHRFWPHIPAVWLSVLAVVCLLYWQSRAGWAQWLMFFALAGSVHMVLDSVGGGIMWLWPLSDHLFSVVTVPATRSHWVLSFLVHWTFLAELVILAVAGWLVLARRTVL